MPIITLHEKQAELAFWNNAEGALLIEAAPGTGKTRVLAARVEYLLTKKKGNHKILCLTYTRKAADEMQERLKAIPKVEERVLIDTCHGFALNILRSRIKELGYESIPNILENQEDRLVVLREAMINTPQYDYEATNVRKYLEMIMKIKREFYLFRMEKTNIDNSIVALYDNYNDLLQSQNLIDYEDILLLAYRIFTERSYIADITRRIYKYILIDEAQDLNYAQYHLIRALCGEEHKNVFMVGDTNQSIFQWNGSSPAYMQKYFVEDFGADKKEMKLNFRSAKQIIKLANQIIPNSINGIENSPIEGVHEKAEAKDEKSEAEYILQEIKSLVNTKQEGIDGVVTLDKIVIIARNHYLFSELKNSFNQDIFFKDKYFVKRGNELLSFESDFMKLFDWGLRLFSNPLDEIHRKKILDCLCILSTTQKLDSSNIWDFLEDLTLKITTNALVSQEQYEYIKGIWKSVSAGKGIMKFSSILEEMGKFVISKKEEWGAETIDYLVEDIEELKNMWRKYLESSWADSRSFQSFWRFLAIGVGGNHKNKGKLMLATPFTTKGLEFDIVFLMGMNDGIFPDYRALQAFERGREEALNEEKNALYVAITRAKRHLYISYPCQRTTKYNTVKKQEISRFLQIKER